MVKQFSLSLLLLIPSFTLSHATPVIDAVKTNNLKELAAFIERHFDVSERDTYNNTPLTHAAFLGNAQAIGMLLAGGAKLSEANNDGNTALHLAAQEGHKPVVELLLSKGANARTKNKKSQTPLNMAVENKRNEVALILAPETKAQVEGQLSKFASIKLWASRNPRLATSIAALNTALLAWIAIPKILHTRALRQTAK